MHLPSPLGSLTAQSLETLPQMKIVSLGPVTKPPFLGKSVGGVVASLLPQRGDATVDVSAVQAEEVP